MSAHVLPDARPVVVGFDGSGSAHEAARWAALEAVRRGSALRLVTAFARAPDRVAGIGSPSERVRDDLMAGARRRIADAVAVAGLTGRDLPVSGDVLVGLPVRVLADETPHAQLLVLGRRGLSEPTVLPAGPVAVGLVARAACPVVVVRGEVGRAASTRPVLVGVDGSNSDAAIAFAFDAAAARGVPLVVLRTSMSWEFASGPTLVMDRREVADVERAALAEWLAGWARKYPDVLVRRVVGRGGPATALVELSRDAQLVVVGSHGRGGMARLLLGSVSHDVLHHSHCPVAVVRPETAAGA